MSFEKHNMLARKTVEIVDEDLFFRSHHIWDQTAAFFRLFWTSQNRGPIQVEGAHHLIFELEREPIHV